jgi:hypothetical protein
LLFLFSFSFFFWPSQDHFFHNRSIKKRKGFYFLNNLVSTVIFYFQAASRDLLFEERAAHKTWWEPAGSTEIRKKLMRGFGFSRYSGKWRTEAPFLNFFSNLAAPWALYFYFYFSSKLWSVRRGAKTRFCNIYTTWGHLRKGRLVI